MENLLTCPMLWNQMEDAWKAGDADGLDQLLNGDQMSEPVLDARMFGSRNDRWLAQIERMLHSDEKYLIIVGAGQDRKSTRLNSSHQIISYAVFCLKKKNNKTISQSQHGVDVDAQLTEALLYVRN